MTPQLQQAISLLQLSTVELEARLQDALESNVMLEDARINDEANDELPGTDESATSEPSRQQDDELDFDAASSSDANSEVDADWSSAAVESSTAGESFLEGGSGSSPEEPQTAAVGDLRSHLEWQLTLTPMSETDHAIALTLIDALDDNGYLGDTVDAICQAFQSETSPDNTITPQEIEAVRHRLQRFDPVGVAATDLADCLTAQLRQFNTETPGIQVAKQLINQYLDLLAKGDTNLLCRRLGVSLEELQSGIDLIRSLDPRPGARINSATPDYIIPDVLVKRRGDKWWVELNTDALPRLRINQLYADSIGTGGQNSGRNSNKGEHSKLHNQLSEARWLLRSLEQRNTTLLQVAIAIVERQQAFLDKGDEHLRPMVLRDIANATEVHESTVSRVTTRKYMHTPRGIYELKYFFSSQLGARNGQDGDMQSATAVQSMIRKLIVEEHPRKPISDSAIAKTLSGRGVNVARRTIAKYREAMAIPPSHERKRLETGA